MVSATKLKQLTAGGIGSKKNFIQYQEGNILTAFTRYTVPKFDVMVADTNTQFNPVTGIQKAVAKLWPELCLLSAEKGSCKLLDVRVVNEKLPDRFQTVAMIVMHNTSGESKEITGVKNLFVSFREAFSTLLEEAVRSKLTIGMPVIGNRNIWAELETIINELCEEHGYTDMIQVYRPKPKVKVK